MKPIKILSIDFDYFIDTDIKTRNTMFPDGADEMPSRELEDKWIETYVRYPHTRDIGVIPQFDAVLDLLKEERFKLGKNVTVYPSHKDLYPTILNAFPKDTHLEIYNIDFHHDMYHLGGDQYNCSNWARRILEEYPNATYKWFRRVDSERMTLFGEVDCYHSPFMPTELKQIQEDIDLVFICLSPEWTPPHLHKKYRQLVMATVK